MEPGAVVEPAGGPHPAERPPVAGRPRVVALAVAVELDALVGRGGSRRGRGTAPRSGWSRRSGTARRRSPTRDRGPWARGRRAPAGPVQLGGVVDGDARRPRWRAATARAGGCRCARPTSRGCGSRATAPSAAAPPGRRPPRRPLGAAHHGVVPARLQVRVQPDPDPPADRAVGRAEVEVPRLAPQLLGPGSCHPSSAFATRPGGPAPPRSHSRRATLASLPMPESAPATGSTPCRVDRRARRRRPRRSPCCTGRRRAGVVDHRGEPARVTAGPPARTTTRPTSLHLAADDVAAVATGTTAPLAVFQAGRLRVGGDLRRLTDATELFARFPGVPA